MALNALSLSVTSGVQGRPFGAVISGQTAGNELSIERGYSPGFSVANGRLNNTGLPYAITTVGIRERNPNTGENRLTAIDIPAYTRDQLEAQALAAVPSKTGWEVYGDLQSDGTYVYTLAIKGPTQGTTLVAAGTTVVTLGTLTLSGSLQIGTAASGTIIGATAGSTITGNIPGITVNSSARTYSGTPTGSAQTIANGLVESLTGASNDNNPSPITVNVATVTISGTPPATATVGTAYSFTPTTANGSGTKTFALTGTLPAGLSFSTSTGAITGTPTTVQTASGLNITVTDSSGSAALGVFSINVSAAAPTLVNLTLSGTLLTGQAASGTIIGANPGSTITGNIPGITINSGARTYSGIPTTFGTIANGLTETDGTATNSPHDSSITVTAPADTFDSTTGWTWDSTIFPTFDRTI